MQALRRVAVVDDNPRGRADFADWVDNLFNAETVDVSEKGVTPESIVRLVQREGIDAVVVDYQLSLAGYSNYDGMDLAVALFDAKVPAVLASSFTRSGIPSYVWNGHKVPAIVEKGHLDDTLEEAMELAFKAVQGKYTEETEPFRTLVRITEVGERNCSVLIPAFSATNQIMVSTAELQERVGSVRLEVDLRMLAETNIGAKDIAKIFLRNFTALPELEEFYAGMLRA